MRAFSERIEEILEIDGSKGEGGGQILRSSLALSAILSRPIRITNIRAGRRNPGLQAQHLTAVNALAEITDAEVEGAKIGSPELTFSPKHLKAGKYLFDVSKVKASAGAVPLVFQAIYLPLAYAKLPSYLTLRGGTHVPWSPNVNYLQEVFLPMSYKFGLDAKIELKRWGWYPQGGGEVEAQIEGRTQEGRTQGSPLQGLQITQRGELIKIEGLSAVSNLPISIAHRQKKKVEEELAKHNLNNLNLKSDIKLFEAPSIGQGTLVFLKAEFENSISGFSALGERGKPAEEVAKEACRQLISFIKSEAAIDPYLSDQLILLIAISEGDSEFTTSQITRHLLTNIWVVEQFLPVKFEVIGDEGESGKILMRR